MRRLVLALLLLAAASSLGPVRRQAVDKCCEEGDVLTFNASGRFECVRPEEHSLQELLIIRQGRPRGLPRCDGLSYLSQRLLVDAANSPSGNACLEIFFDKHSLQDFPVIVYCTRANSRARLGRLNYMLSPLSVNGDGNISSASEQPETGAMLPEILNFRKCCGPGSYYDAERKHCLEGRADFSRLLGHLRRVDFIDVYSGAPACEHVLLDYKVPVADVHYRQPDISVSVAWQGELRNLTINLDNACLDAPPNSDFIVARVCVGVDYCEANPCVRKCCPENAATSCMQSSFVTGDFQTFRTAVAAAAAAAVAENNLTETMDTQRYGLMIGRPCNLVYDDTGESWTLGKLGEIVIPDDAIFNHANSCLEYVYNSTEVDDGLHTFFCFVDETLDYSYKPRYRYMITAGLVLMSCFFLLATLLVYVSLPSLRNLHGKTIMCHVASLILAYACLAANTILSVRLDNYDLDEHTADVICRYTAYAMMFSFYSAFLWLNVMCFDIYWTFGGLHGAASASAKRAQQRNRFLSYCAYAWGLALLLTGVTLLAEHLRLFGLKIGRERCWFDDSPTAETLFFTSPITVTLMVNIVFFVVTSRRCSKVKAEIKRAMANMKDSRTRKFHSDRTRLIMNLKLFIVMGIPWLLESLSSLLSNYYNLPTWLDVMIFVPDVVNSLQGLWIFILFVLKSKVYRALRKRFGSRQETAGSNQLAPRAGRNVHKSTSSSTLTSNFVVSSSS